MDLQPQPGLTQVQPDHAPFLRQAEGEQKPRLVPRPELEPHGHAPRGGGRRRPRQLQEALGAGERHGDGNWLSTREGHIALRRKHTERREREEEEEGREKVITREIKQHET